MATPFFSVSSSNDPNTPYTRPALLPDLNTAPNPKPRGRKGGGKSQNGNKNKTHQRGDGIAELERLRCLNEKQPLPPPLPPITTTCQIGVRPILSYCLPGQPIPDPRLYTLVGIPDELSELPSMPNPFHLDHHINKKKRLMIGEDITGFTKGDKNNHFLALNNGGGFSSAALPTTTVTGSEVVAVHRKWTGSGNVMMEYGFFPGKLEESNEQQSMNFETYYNNNNNNCYYNNHSIHTPLSSPSSSSSLSSLTTATTTTTTLDLSLKLSSF